MNSFADTLVYLRKRDKMTQQELADKIGMSRSLVGMFESGNRMPSIEVLEAIADTFNVNIDFLVGHVDTGTFSRTFIKNLQRIMDTSSAAKIEAYGVDTYEVSLILTGTMSLSFDYACKLAEQLGCSIDEMLDQKDPATMEDDEVTQELIKLMSGLSPEKQAAAAEYLRYLSSTEGK